MATPLRVLILEDRPADVQLIVYELKQAGFDPDWKTTCREDEFLELLNWRPEVILSDYSMPSFDALRALELTRKAGVDVPFIVVSGSIGEDVAVDTMKRGVTDYLLKDRLGRLGTAVQSALRQRRLAEESRRSDIARHSAEALFQKLVENSLVGIQILQDGRHVFANSKVAEIFGYTEAELLSLQSWQVLVAEDDRERVASEVRRRLSGETPVAHYVFKGLRKDQAIIDVEVRSSRIEFNGHPAALGMLIDITDRKKIESTLNLRDRAIQAVTQGIVITDPAQHDNPIVYASPGFEKLTGYPTAEVLGRNCRFLQGIATDPETVARVRRALREGQPCHVEILNYRKDGTSFWNELSISPVHDDQGRLTHFVGSQSDISERRNLEAQLRQVQKMEAIGRLAGGIAHDFNNLLTIINGYCELLLDTMEPENKLAEFVVQIQKAGDRAAKMTRQLLAFSRKQMLQPVVLNLNTLLGDMEAMIRRLMGDDIDVRLALHPDLRTIHADRSQMEQVILNLIVNARDAMTSGGSLTVETANIEVDDRHAGHPDAHCGRNVLLTVCDTGCGMDKETLQRIFEPFFTTKEPDKGTGLGMATVYGIVKQSNGHIEVSSEPGLGTSVKIFLPADSSRVEEPGGEASDRDRALKNERILLIEDEPGVRTLTATFLQANGYQVSDASNGEEALKLLAKDGTAFDLVITDVAMPVMGGRVLVEHLSRILPDVPVLFMSGYTEDAVLRHDIQSCETVLLQKPFTSAELLARVREALEAPR